MKKQQRDNGPKVGSSVVVKMGCIDDESGTDMGGWQGRIARVDLAADGGPFVTIRWDSITLKAMPGSFVEDSEVQGLDWSEYVLGANEVEPAQPRDSEKDVAAAKAEIKARYAWSFLGEEGRRVNDILAGVDPDDEMACFDAWEKHLTGHLAFPFEARVEEFQEHGPLQSGDRLKVTGIALADGTYGLIVDVWKGRRKYAFPLCDLATVDKASPNHELVQDYCVWFANR